MSGFFRKNVIMGGAEIVCRLPLVFTLGYLARSVGAEIYGAWALVLVYQGLLSCICSLGLSSSLSRLASVGTEGRAKGLLLWSSAAMGLAVGIAGAVTFLLEDRIGTAIGIPAEMHGLVMLAIVLTLSSVTEGALDAYFKAREKVARQVLFVLTRSMAEVLAVLVVFGVFSSPESSTSTLLTWYVFILAATKIAIYPLLVQFSSPSVELPSRAEQLSFLRYGAPMIATAVVAWFVGQGDRLILGQFVTTQALGIYALGASLAAYLTYFGYAVNPLLLPRASRLYEEGLRGDIQVLYRDSQRVLLALYIGALAAVAVFSTNIVELVAGLEFEGAGRVLLVLGIAVAIERILGIYQYVFHLVKKTGWILKMQLVYAVLVATVVSFAAYTGGITLVPWGILAVAIVFNVLRYFIAQRELDLRIGRFVGVGIAVVTLFPLGLEMIATNWDVEIRAVIVIGLWILLAGALWGGHRWSRVGKEQPATVGH